MEEMKPISQEYIDSQLKNEENTKLYNITPILQERWGKDGQKIVQEYKIDAGKIQFKEDENKVSTYRGEIKKVDYLLLMKGNLPLALVEAKSAYKTADDGYSQAREYALLLNVPFAYSTNGVDMIELDLITNKNREMKLVDFPYQNELWLRYKQEKGLLEVEDAFLMQPYYDTVGGKEARYYQRNAINRVIEHVALGNKRGLLVLATGTGKTYIAFQIIWRMLKAKKARRVLFLADRNILVDQARSGDFRPFEDKMVKVVGSKIDKAHEVYLSLYQQLKTEKEEYYKKFEPDFFDLIVVDECHRGSANEDSSWREILDYFSSATQIGLTATPVNELEIDDNGNVVKDIDGKPKVKKGNYDYFGEPIYTYSLKQGIDDGFLAPYKVVSVNLNIDKEGYTPKEGTKDDEGVPIKIQTYYQKDFDRKIVVKERREKVAERITQFLKDNNCRYSKTIIFCEDIPHCHSMVRLLQNLNSDMCEENPNYIVQITGDNEEGKAQLDNFRNPNSKFPVIAVTSQLLSTGVDVPTCEVVVLDKSIGSMVDFKQIIGRGTRVRETFIRDKEEHSKMFFTILDFRRNYRNFNDPEFDGEAVEVWNVGENEPFPMKFRKHSSKKDKDGTPPQNIRKAVVSGVEVSIIDEDIEYYDDNGKVIEKKSIYDGIKENMLSDFDSYEKFFNAFITDSNKGKLVNKYLLGVSGLEEKFKDADGYSLDYFDILCNIVYDKVPVSKLERIEKVSNYISELSEDRQKVVKLLLNNSYLDSSFDNLYDIKIFNLPYYTNQNMSVLKAQKIFGSKVEYNRVLREIEYLLYS